MYPNDAEVRRILLEPVSPEWKEACARALKAFQEAVERGEIEPYAPPEIPYEPGCWPHD